VGKDSHVGAEDVAGGELVGVFETCAGSAVVGEADEELSVRLDGKGGEFDGQAGADEAAILVAGQIGTGIYGEVQRSEFFEADVEAGGSARVQGVLATALFSPPTVP
jgi:hypothetical protein